MELERTDMFSVGDRVSSQFKVDDTDIIIDNVFDADGNIVDYEYSVLSGYITVYCDTEKIMIKLKNG